MPKLTIVIGANGAGKSTWCDRNRKERLPTDFYNADSIAKGLGDWNSPRKQQAARELVDQTIEEHPGGPVRAMAGRGAVRVRRRSTRPWRRGRRRAVRAAAARS